MKQDTNINKLTHKSQNKTVPKQRKEHTYIHKHTTNNKIILNIHKSTTIHKRYTRVITANSTQQIQNFTSNGSPTQVQS